MKATPLPKKTRIKIDSQLKSLFDNSDQFKICMLDLSGTIIAWNKSSEKMTGFTSKEMEGTKYPALIAVDKKSRIEFTKILAAAKKKGQHTNDGIYGRKNGTHYWARTHVIPVRKSDGSVNFYVLLTRDISKERVIGEKRDAYISIASHELRNPLATRSLYTELLEHELDLDSDKKMLICFVICRAKRLAL
jgi:PAS domain S-box-containing protein